MSEKPCSSFSGLNVISKLELIFLSSLCIPLTQRPNGNIIRPLSNFFEFVISVPPSKKTKKGVITSDITINPSHKLWLRLFLPVFAKDTSIPVIVYFHGGGFAQFSPKTKHFDRFCRRIACELSAVVISVDYRRSPEYKVPSQYEDGFDVLKFIDEENIEGFPVNVDLKRCFIAGDSAGGNLTHHVAVKASEYEFKAIKIQGLILIQPFFGGEERTNSDLRLRNNMPLKLKTTDWFWKAFLPDGSNRDHPVTNVSAPPSINISNLAYPPTLVIVGGLDILQDWQRRYYEWVKRSGKEVKLVEYFNMFHGFYVFPELQEASMMINEIKSFVQNHV